MVTVCTISATLYQDIIGRRPALLVGSVVCAISMLGFAGVLTANPVITGSVSNAAIALGEFRYIGSS